MDNPYSPRTVHQLLVYGTMKRGFINHERLGRNRRYFGEVVTAAPMFGMKSCQTGGMYRAPVAYLGGNLRVRGELYQITGDVLRNADMCEGHPDIYRRQPVRLQGRNQPVWIYLYVGDRRNLGLEGVEQLPDQTVRFVK